jgi:Protein of unknown function (DUF5131)
MLEYLAAGDVERHVERAMCDLRCAAGARLCGFGNDGCRLDPDWPLSNVWLGVSIENRRFVNRADDLRRAPAVVRFVSAEPLLGPLVGNVLSDAECERAMDRLPPDCALTMPEDESAREWWAGMRRLLAPNLNLAGIDWVIVGGESGPRHRRMRLAWARDLRDACRDAGVVLFVKQLGGSRPGGGLEELPADLRVREWPPATTGLTAA